MIKTKKIKEGTIDKFKSLSGERGLTQLISFDSNGFQRDKFTKAKNLTKKQKIERKTYLRIILAL